MDNTDPNTIRFTAKRAPAFTLFELLITITIIAVVAVSVIPAISSGDQLHLTAASSIMSSDIEYAEVLTIAHPENPVVVVFNPGKSSYSLCYASDTGSPIPRVDTGKAYEVMLGHGRGSSAAGVSFSLVDMPDGILAFNEQGGIADITLHPAVIFNLADRQLAIQIAPTTGTISESTDIDAITKSQKTETKQEVKGGK